MITLRPAAERGHANHGWLNARHSFSFANYRDPKHMGFRKLRVINEDTIQAGTGFGEHPHDNMEIITYVIEGSLAHKDSAGNLATLESGGVQVMTAGSGVSHSEFNGSETEDLHLLQIWIQPDKRDTEPRHSETRFDDGHKRDKLQAIASNDGRGGSLEFGVDAVIYASVLSIGERLQHELGDGRHSWLQVVSGVLDVNGTTLRAGDGAAISEEAALDLRASEESEFLLFDLA